MHYSTLLVFIFVNPTQKFTFSLIINPHIFLAIIEEKYLINPCDGTGGVFACSHGIDIIRLINKDASQYSSLV